VAWIVLAQTGEEADGEGEEWNDSLVPIVDLVDLTGLETGDGCCLNKRAANYIVCATADRSRPRSEVSASASGLV
jgi:hypothetical protein